VKVFYDNNNATISVTNEISAAAPPFSENVRLGIGLPLVERIVKDAGGSWLDEHTDSTYKARITLPLYEKNSSAIKNFKFEQSMPEFNVSQTQEDKYIEYYLNRFKTEV
jgi:hypothetical protein